MGSLGVSEAYWRENVARDVAATARFPHLDLGRYPAWKKPVAALSFLPAAFAAIRQQCLVPSYTFHLMDRLERPVGVSAGDVCYFAGEEDTNLITELVVALEDRRFYSHRGVDLWGVLRALKSNLLARRVVQGGSTITQQLVRNTLLTPDRSFTRKALELLLALSVERHYSKREILGLYSQFVYVGPGVRGFQAASKLIYRRSLGQLDIDGQCAIVGLLRRPSRDYPLTTPDNLRRRRTFVTQRLAGVVNAIASSRHVASASPASVNPVSVRGLLRPRWTRAAEHACATAGAPAGEVKRVGLTIDRSVQARLDRTLRAVSEDLTIDCLAAVVLENRSGDVLAESAWAHGAECTFSPTFAGSLQPGSTFKPFAVLAALEEGFGVDLRLPSAPFESSLIRNADGSPWRVRNYAFQYRGEVTLAEALRLSDNTAIARLTEYLSPNALASVYARFGLAEPGGVTPAIALGAVENGVSLLQIASAYSAIARLGVYVKPRFLRFIHYADGAWWRPATAARWGVSDYAAIRGLQQVLAATLPGLAPLGFSGKTGTTRRGSLVAAYNDFASVAIWLGYARPPVEGGLKGLSALKVLERFVAEALLGHNRDPFSI